MVGLFGIMGSPFKKNRTWRCGGYPGNKNPRYHTLNPCLIFPNVGVIQHMRITQMFQAPIAGAYVGSWKKPPQQKFIPCQSIYIWHMDQSRQAFVSRGFGWNSVWTYPTKFHPLAAILHMKSSVWTWVLDLPSCVPIHMAAFMFRLSVITPPRRKQKTYSKSRSFFVCAFRLRLHIDCKGSIDPLDWLRDVLFHFELRPARDQVFFEGVSLQALNWCVHQHRSTLICPTFARTSLGHRKAVMCGGAVLQKTKSMCCMGWSDVFAEV